MASNRRCARVLFEFASESDEWRVRVRIRCVRSECMRLWRAPATQSRDEYAIVRPRERVRAHVGVDCERAKRTAVHLRGECGTVRAADGCGDALSNAVRSGGDVVSAC